MVKRVYALFLLTSFLALVCAEKKVVCYYGSWATYRNGNGKCEVNNLNVNVCTHLVYSFVGINEDGTVRIMDPWLELPDNWGKDNFRVFNNLKKKNPKLKTLVAIGGWNEGSAKFSKVANDPTLRQKFAKNAAEFVTKYGFDGMDVDWEYPAQRDSPNKGTDKKAFTLLLAEMRQEFDKKSLLLSAAVAAVKSSASLSYDIPALSRYLDFINVMTYDLHGAWDSITGHNAALHRYDGEGVTAQNSMNVEIAINYWLSEGASPDKLIMGIPLYGRTFRLANSANNKVGAASTGAGIAGQYTYENGLIGYNELCEKRLTQSWPEKWDSKGMVPYTSNGNNWISYDNEKSIRLKVQFALSKKLNGIMVWSIETDDFRGVCQSNNFPLLRAINSELGKMMDVTSTSNDAGTTAIPDSTTSLPSTTEESKPTEDETITEEETPPTEDPLPENFCKQSGYVRDPKDCSKFYQCVKKTDGVSYELYEFYCPSGLFFDDIMMICNYPQLVNCD